MESLTPAFPEAGNHPDSPEDGQALEQAVRLLESPSFTIRIANMVGMPVEWAFDRLPASAAATLQKAIHAALEKATSAALRTLDDSTPAEARPRTHTVLVAATGALGGFFGLKGTLVELPVTTTIIMRSIADLARSEGFAIRHPAVQADCLQVFALGGRSADDDAADSAYYASRIGLAEVTKEASRLLAEAAMQHGAHHAARTAAQGLQFTPSQAAAWLAQILEAVAQRFGIRVTEKFALQAAPVLGALSGATLNAMFISHYQDMARGHFTIRRLEAKYGQTAVREAYMQAQRKLGIGGGPQQR